MKDDTLWSSFKQIRYVEMNDETVTINKGYAGNGGPIKVEITQII